MTKKFEITRVYIPGLPPKWTVEGDRGLTDETTFDTREAAEARREELLKNAA